MKGSSATAVWPKVPTGSGYVKSAGPQTTEMRCEGDEVGSGPESNVPSFQQSFGADFNLPEVSGLSVGDSGERSTAGILLLDSLILKSNRSIPYIIETHM